MEFEAVCDNSVNISIKATSWIGIQLPVPVSIFSNLREEPILCAKEANLLIIPFAAQLEILVAKKSDMRFKFLGVKTEMKTRLKAISYKLRGMTETEPDIGFVNDNNLSRTSPRTQQKELFDLQRHSSVQYMTLT